MQKAIFLLIAFGAVFVFYHYRTETIRADLARPESIAEESLIPISDVVQGDEDEVQFSLNADSLDQYLGEENPFYSGGFVPQLNELGMLTPASEVVLKQFAQFEFIDQEIFRNERGRSAVLQYARGSVVNDSAAALVGSFKGHAKLGGKKAEFWIEFVPVGTNGLVYDAQWSFADKVVRRFRRIPEQSHWINIYLPTAWVDEDNLRISIPRGALMNSGLEKTPAPADLNSEIVSGYELRGKITNANSIEGDVFAVGSTQELGEVVKHVERMGSFTLLRHVEP